MGARPSSFRLEERPVVKAPAREWSKEQQAIFDWFQQKWSGVGGAMLDSRDFTNPNLVVRARAGTGKTATIVEGINRAPEQSILLCAFNKRIAEELNSRISNGAAEAKTLHSLGYQAIRREWPRMGVSKGDARAECLTDQTEAKQAPRQIRRLVSNLHTKLRDMGTELDTNTVREAALFFDLVPDESWGRYDLEFVVRAAIQAVRHATEFQPTHDIGIDFADMIFLPLAWNLLTPDYQLVVVDEAQDMTLAQLDMAQRSCNGRICVVGDDRQAIYGFRGADSRSLDRLKRELGAAASPRLSPELPLCTTYRCGQSIVRRAQVLVPDIQAAPSNPEGVVDECSYARLLQEAAPGDFVLSRINAPLVSITLAMIRQHKRARMAGRDIGAGLKAVVNKLKLQNHDSVETLLDRVNEWERKTTTRLASYGQLDLVDRCRDQADTLRALAEDSDATNVGNLIQTLEWLFEDGSSADTIVCSSVHKAKGLETNRVWVLQESFYRRGRTPEEENIEYVAVTRAKSHLTLVSDVPGLGRRG